MTRAAETNARADGSTLPPTGDCRNADPVTSRSVFVAALDRALVAAQHLGEALETAACRQAEMVKQLTLVRVTAGTSTAHEERLTPCPVCTSPNKICAAVLPLVRSRDALSPREREVLRLLAAGQSNRRIAAVLCLSPRTVQRHVANVYLKIGAHCRAEATAYALDHGLR